MRVDTGKYPDGVDPARIKRLKLLSKLATFTCILMYGWLKTYKDWPIIISNMPGILFGLVTFVTVFVH